jgi:hypothetical protein
VLAARQPRPRLTAHDRLFWEILRRFWPDWRCVVVIVHPETVVGWHRAGFKLYGELDLAQTNAIRQETDTEPLSLTLGKNLRAREELPEDGIRGESP